MVYIYVLKLKEDKYYVGKTNDPLFRIENHMKENGSEWTKLYKPLKLIELKANCDDYDEDKTTIKYMNKYGINNVRGGSFVSIKLKKSSIETLRLMMNSANDRCFKCGKDGHFYNQCKEKYEDEDEDEDENEDEDEDDDEDDNNIQTEYLCEFCDEMFDNEYSCKCHEKKCKKNNKKTNIYNSSNKCFRCGRKGHYSTSCYATMHINGYYINY